jgi:hypothetical protein
MSTDACCAERTIQQAISLACRRVGPKRLAARAAVPVDMVRLVAAGRISFDAWPLRRLVETAEHVASQPRPR